jgi:hypothetical protein
LTNFPERRLLALLNPVDGPKYGYVEDVADDGTQNYHGMLLSVQRRRANGLTVQANYTYAHCIGDPGDSQPGIGTSAQYPGRRFYERGNCDGDKRQVVNFSTVYATPQFASRALQIVASNWQISGIVRFQTGSPFAVLSGADTCLCGAQGNNRADQLVADADVYTEDRNPNQYLKPASARAFARPANGQWGTAHQNYIGPWELNINTALTRKFQVREGQTVEFRAEAFNVPNRLNANNPVNTINNPNFGRVLTAKDPRIIQLALKYVF